MDSTCSSCKFFSALHSECRKNVPTTFLLQPSPGQVSAISASPPVKPEFWCGEHVYRSEPISN